MMWVSPLPQGARGALMDFSHPTFLPNQNRGDDSLSHGVKYLKREHVKMRTVLTLPQPDGWPCWTVGRADTAHPTCRLSRHPTRRSLSAHCPQVLQLETRTHCLKLLRDRTGSASEGTADPDGKQDTTLLLPLRHLQTSRETRRSIGHGTLVPCRMWRLSCQRRNLCSRV